MMLNLVLMLTAMSADKKIEVPPVPIVRTAAPNHIPARHIAGSISDTDYPAEAQRAGESGVSRLRFVVDEAGVVDQCDVIQSSGSQSLDTASCALVLERFRYTPARDATGKAVRDTKTQRITWRMPVQAPPPMVAQMKPHNVDIELVVNPDGSVQSCKAYRFEPAVSNLADPCPGIVKIGGFKPFSGPAKKKLRYRTSLDVVEQP